MKRKQKLRLNCKISSRETPKVEPVLLYFSLHSAADELLLFHSASGSGGGGEISVNKDEEVLNHFLGQSKQSESKPASELSSLLRLLLLLTGSFNVAQ